MLVVRYLVAIILLRQAYFNKKKRYLYFSLGVILLMFSFIRTAVYQQAFGQKDTDFFLSKNFEANITPDENKTTFSHKNGKYEITCEKQAEIDLFARVAYIDYNDTLFSSFDYYSDPVYDAISPIDLSVFVGSMATNWKMYKVKHERRAMFVYGNVVLGEWENMHIIPANKNIRFGFDTIKKGDEVQIKGFLINWQGVPPYDYIKIKTALSFDTISSEKLGGRITWLCMQLYVTELRANGYIYK